MSNTQKKKRMGRPSGVARNAPLPAQNPEFRLWRMRMGLSQPAAAGMLGLHETTVARYDRGQLPLDHGGPSLGLSMYALEMHPQVQAMAVWKLQALAVIDQLADAVPTYPTIVGDTDLSNLGHDIAVLEGWDIFEVDDHLEIQRDDETAIFADDDQAMRWVKKKAKAGSVLHTWALKLHRTKLRVAA